MDVCGLLKGKEGVDASTFDRSAHTNGALLHVTNPVFKRSHSLIFSCNIYLEGEE